MRTLRKPKPVPVSEATKGPTGTPACQIPLSVSPWASESIHLPPPIARSGTACRAYEFPPCQFLWSFIGCLTSASVSCLPSFLYLMSVSLCLLVLSVFLLSLSWPAFLRLPKPWALCLMSMSVFLLSLTARLLAPAETAPCGLPSPLSAGQLSCACRSRGVSRARRARPRS